MFHKSRAIFLFLTIVAMLFVSAVGTTTAYADDGTPPPPPAETGEVDPPASEGEVVTEPVEAVPPATEEQPVATEPAVVEPAATEPAVVEPAATELAVVEPAIIEPAPVAEEQSPAEAAPEAATILEQVPDDTTVTVLNEEGEAQPLTSQGSAEAILTSDPIWCPAYQDPTPGENGCTTSFNSFDALLTFLSGNADYQGAGTIFVQQGTYNGGESSINFNSPAYDLSNISGFNLTVQGGWDTSGTNTNPDNPTVFNAPIVIGTIGNPWGGSLTFDGIKITNANQTGLTLFSDADITITNVAVTNSQAGADLNAGGSVIVDSSQFNNNKQFGAKVNAGGFVAITNSEFNDNDGNGKDKEDGYGLKVDSQDEVYLDTVYANSNEKFGADITATGSVTVLNSFFSGNISYTHNCYKTCYECKETVNGGYGLKIVSASSAYLAGVTANENYLFGAHVEALDAKVYNSTFTGSEEKPQGYGLEVLTTGGKGVTLDNVRASNNDLFGANITAGPEGVVITNSFFDGNTSYYNSCTGGTKRTCYECTETYYGSGLQVVTTGKIDMAAVSASNNYLFGAHLTGANVGIDTGTFSGNSSGTTTLTGEGLKITSTANVNLNDVEANNNQFFGGDILAVNVVNVTNSTFNGQQVFSGTKLVGGGYGLQVVATGETSKIHLTVVTASYNYLYGMHLVASNVQISGDDDTKAYSRAEHNKEGVKIESTGSVNIDMLVASENKLAGATILSGTNTTFDGTVQISQSFFSGNFSYTSSCKGKTYSGYGLSVITTGDDIGLVNVEANDNYLYGAHLEGASIEIGTEGIFTNSFSGNGTSNLSDHVGKGLEIISTGQFETVRLSNVKANDNQLFGANIEADGFVSISDSFFSGNASYYSNCGSSQSSAGNGKSSGSGSKGCTECTQTYDGYGLRVVTTGDIYVGNVTAEKNYLYGAHLEGAQVDIFNSSFSLNNSPTQQGKTPTGRGLEVTSTGNTSLQGVKASNNQLFGADIQAGGNVLINASFFDNNKYSVSTTCKSSSAGYGLKVVATGSISLGDPNIVGSRDQALGNGAEGATLNGQSTVTVVDGLFNNNGANGLTITANSDITLTNVTATGNKGNGVEATGVCTNVVHVNGGKFADNDKYGIKVVNATYDQVNPPTFSGNDSGNVFTNSSTCASSDDDSGSSGSGNSGGGSQGGHWWYWWWFWHHGYGHH